MRLNDVLRVPYIAVIIVSFLMFSCSSKDIGPSDEKVRLDVEERIETISSGLVSVTDFEIVKRDVLSEDRVKFQMTMAYKMDQEKVQRYKAAQKRSFLGSMKPVRIAQQMDGKTEDATWLYQLRGNGIWELAKSMPGHQ